MRARRAGAADGGADGGGESPAEKRDGRGGGQGRADADRERGRGGEQYADLNGQKYQQCTLEQQKKPPVGGESNLFHFAEVFLPCKINTRVCHMAAESSRVMQLFA